MFNVDVMLLYTFYLVHTIVRPSVSESVTQSVCLSVRLSVSIVNKICWDFGQDKKIEHFVWSCQIQIFKIVFFTMSKQVNLSTAKLMSITPQVNLRLKDVVTFIKALCAFFSLSLSFSYSKAITVMRSVVSYCTGQPHLSYLNDLCCIEGRSWTQRLKTPETLSYHCRVALLQWVACSTTYI